LPRKKKSDLSAQSLLQKFQNETKSGQSYISLALGLLIVIVAGILVFNFFKKTDPALGPSQTTTVSEKEDVKPENLPGKYTVKEGDTLFTIAEKYYKDGEHFGQIVEANKIANADIISTGQVLEIPKLPEGVGGASNLTIWGEKITGETYTVVEGDWLSTIAGRAYGDPAAFQKIALANNIANPDNIEPGQVLKIPRN